MNGYEKFLNMLKELGEDDAIALLETNKDSSEYLFFRVDYKNRIKITICRPPVSEKWMTIIVNYRDGISKLIDEDGIRVNKHEKKKRKTCSEK